MTGATDRYAEWDAAYLLGALSASERHEFEDHLSGCSRCQAAVSDLAGMPGLLAQVPAEEAAAVMPEEPLEGDGAVGPPSVEAPLRGRRRVGHLIGAAAVLIALLMGGIGGYAVRGLVDRAPEQSDSATQPYRLAFTPVIPSTMTAVVDVVPQPGGTEFRVECQYGKADLSQPGGAYRDYALYIVDKGGQATRAKTWTVRPYRVMRPTGVSPLPLTEISAVEIRIADSGQTLMRAPIG